MLDPSTPIAPTFGDSPIAGGACAAPGTRQRIVQIRTLREAGYSLNEIAGRYGVTRERVRQILRAHGEPDPALVAKARRERAAQLADSSVERLLTLWREGHGARSAANALGLQAAACKSTIERFATDVDKAARRASMSDARGAQTYSERDIIAALRAATAGLGHVPSAKQYALLARGLQLLRSVVEELGEIPAVLSYDRHAADRSDLPSSATLRNRLGRWSAITARLAAERELALACRTPG